MKVSIWISALRLRTLPLSLASIGMGSFLAASHHQFKFDILIWASITTIFLQILSNLANDYGDSINGADHANRQGPPRAVQSGAISVPAIKLAIVLFSILSLTSGLTLLYISLGIKTSMFYVFLTLGVASIGAAYFYTAGSKPYGYAGLGDISVLLFFGFLAVLGTYYLHTHLFKWLNFLPAFSMGLFAIAVLNINNIRDIKSDKKAGKKSIPVRLGHKKAIKYHVFLLLAGYMSGITYLATQPYSIIRWIILLAAIPLIINARAIIKNKDPKYLDPYLKQMSVSTLLFMLIFGISILL
jgi:1,4-dihydroxy-2-naphthoate octaprenyltransferase